MIKQATSNIILIAILFPLTAFAELINLLPGSNITVQEIYNDAIQTTTIYCSAYSPDYSDPRTTFSIKKQGERYQVIMNGHVAETNYFFNNALNTLKILMADINPWDITQASCSIQQSGSNYQVMINQDVAEVNYFFNNAHTTLKQLREAGICR